MPIVETGFQDKDGKPDHGSLLTYGPSIQVAVSHVPAAQALGQAQNVTETVHALVDTGACQSCIDIDLATKLKLPVVDVQNIAGAGGAAQHDVYMAMVQIPALNFHQRGRFTGVKLQDGGQVHQVLLGRTFLESCILIYDGVKGQVTITSKF